MYTLWQKLSAEFIGTFFLFFTIGITTLYTAPGVIPPLAIGLMLVVLVYAGGHISGAHYNPAVSTALAIRGAFPWSDYVPYVATQLVAACSAAGTVYVIYGKTFGPASATPVMSLVLSEFLFTFLLAYVILTVATSKKIANNQFFGLAIGFTVLVGAFAVGPISGGCFNPAVTTGSLLLGGISLANYFIYVLTQLVAGAAAGSVFLAINSHERSS